MQFIINYIGKPKFNWSDIITICATVYLYENEFVVWSIVCFVIGLVLSVVLESKVKE